MRLEPVDPPRARVAEHRDLLGREVRHREHARAHTTVTRIFDHLIERGDSVDEVVDYVAGMTDRFALSYAESL